MLKENEEEDESYCKIPHPKDMFNFMQNEQKEEESSAQKPKKEKSDKVVHMEFHLKNPNYLQNMVKSHAKVADQI